HLLGVGDIVVGDHAAQAVARYRQDHGGGAGGEDQPVVAGAAAVVGEHHAPLAVDAHYLAPQAQVDAVPGVPVEAVEHDVVKGAFAGQYRRQQDAVVVGVRLGAEHGDVVQVRGKPKQFLQGPDPGHAVARHHQFESVHVAVSCLNA